MTEEAQFQGHKMRKDRSPAVENCLTKAKENRQMAVETSDQDAKENYGTIAKSWARLAQSHREADEFDEQMGKPNERVNSCEERA